MFGGTTRPHCLLNADARRELPTRRQRASPPRLGSECPVRAVKRFSACDRFSLPDAFCAGVVLPHGRLPHYSRFRLKSQRRNRRKTGGVGNTAHLEGILKAGQRVQGAVGSTASAVGRSPCRIAGADGDAGKESPAEAQRDPGREGTAVLHRQWDEHPTYPGCVPRIPDVFRRRAGAPRIPASAALRILPSRAAAFRFCMRFLAAKKAGEHSPTFFAHFVCSFECTAGNRVPA